MNDDLFYGYDLKSRNMDVRRVIDEHIKRFGTPPFILALNQLDSESIVKPTEIPTISVRWTLKGHCYAGIKQESEE